MVKQGMRKWEKETCINFRERTDQKDYVYIFRGAGLGKQKIVSLKIIFYL